MRRMLFALATLLILLLVAFPLIAQDTAGVPKPGSTVVAVGPVVLTDDEIVVGGYIIAPAGAFRASILDTGDVVMITGVLLPDEITIQADTIEFFVDADVSNEDREQGTGHGSDQGNGRANSEHGAADEVGDDTAAADCNREDHPLGQRLAEVFGVTYAEIMDWRCQTFGFGEIMRAYTLAALTGEPAAAYFALRSNGVGWGVIMNEAGLDGEDVPVPVVIPGRPIELCRGDDCTDGRPNCPRHSCSAPGQNP